MNQLSCEPSARLVLLDPSLINFSAFKVSLIPHHGEVICYVFSASNPLAVPCFDSAEIPQFKNKKGPSKRIYHYNTGMKSTIQYGFIACCGGNLSLTIR